MKRRNLQQLSPLIGLALFAFALYVLNRILGENSFRHILTYISEFPAHRILAAIGLTAASYAILTLYDHLALRYLGQNIGVVRVSLASFISYCFSRNIGFALLTGGSIRYRFYSAWGLSAEEVARLISFAAVTFTLGLLTMGGSLLLFSPAALPELPFPVWTFAPIGFVALSLMVAYLLLVGLRVQPFRIRKWEFPLPTLRQSLAQLVVGSLDWTLKASILYYLLSGVIPLSLPGFLEIYLLAQIVATLSHVPGGLGVFETVVVVLIPEIAAADLLAILLVYRSIYYLLPFGCAILLLGGLETLLHVKSFHNVRGYLGNWLSALAPPVFAAAVLICGAILIFSCVTPTMAQRLEWLAGSVPLPVVELAHFLLSLAAAGLLLLARGVQRRLRQAYVMTLFLLTVSIALALLKGLSYEQAIMLMLILAALIPSRELFYRQTSLLEEQFSLGWITIILTVFGSALWLVSISYEPQTFNINRLWYFAFVDDAARSLRALSAATCVLLMFLFLKLYRPKMLQTELADSRALEIAQLIIASQPVASACLAMVGDKKFLFTKSEDAFFMYATTEQFWVTLGDPIGDVQQIPELAWCFREVCEHERSLPIFYLVGDEYLGVYLDMGMALLKVGDEASMALETHSDKQKADEHSGDVMTDYRFEIKTAPNQSLHSSLKQLCVRWEGQKEIAEQRFCQGSFDAAYIERFPLALVHCNEQPVAFALILQGAEKAEFTIDLLRFSPQFGTKAAATLLAELMDWGRRAGFHRFNFGIVPDLDDTQHLLAPRWRALGTSAFRNGQSFSSAREMRDFIAHVQPKMDPRYAVFPGGVSPVDVLENIAVLIDNAAPCLRQRVSTTSARRYCDIE